MPFTDIFKEGLVFTIFLYSVYGTLTGSHSFSNASVNASTFALITTTHVSEHSALSYSTNQSFSSENLTSFVLSHLSSFDGAKVALNDSMTNENYSLTCPTGLRCTDLPVACIICDLHNDCIYGQETAAECRAREDVVCNGPRQFEKSYECRYCYQTLAKFHRCTNNTSCRANVYPRQRYISNCSVPDDMLCLGNRKFLKMQNCNWTSGKRWRTALILSITLGGLGAERFYLGQWREGLGKLFSFGGLGVWTLVDVVLVATGYLTPADGSLYI